MNKISGLTTTALDGSTILSSVILNGKSIDMAPSKVNGDKNETGIKRILKAMKSEWVYEERWTKNNAPLTMILEAIQ